MAELEPRDSLLLNLTATTLAEVQRQAEVASNIGIRRIQIGAAVAARAGWHACADIAAENQLMWVADAGIYNDPYVTTDIVGAIAEHPHPPVFITVQATADIDALVAAKAAVTPEEPKNCADKIEEAKVGILGIAEFHYLSPRDRAAAVAEFVLRARLTKLDGVVVTRPDVVVAKNTLKGSALRLVVGRQRVKGIPEIAARPPDPAAPFKVGADIITVDDIIMKAEQPQAVFMNLLDRIQEIGK